VAAVEIAGPMTGATGPAPYYCTFDQLVLGADAVTAAHALVADYTYPAMSFTTVEQIVTKRQHRYTQPRQHHHPRPGPRAAVAEAARAVRRHAHLESRRQPAKRPAELTRTEPATNDDEENTTSPQRPGPTRAATPRAAKCSERA
jgi:hypothetical protein